MGYLGRVWKTFTGQGKSRLPQELAILGGPADLITRMRGLPDTEQEQLFADYVLDRHACALDWRATGADICDELRPLLTEEEKRALPPVDQLPDESALAVVALRQALAGLPRTLVQTESFGDFSFLFVLPRAREKEFLECVGPWLITPSE